MPPQKIGLFLAGLNAFVFPRPPRLRAGGGRGGASGHPRRRQRSCRSARGADRRWRALRAVADASNIDDFAAKIDMVFRDHRQTAHMVALGLKLAGRYSVAGMVEAYAGLIRQSLGTGASTGASKPATGPRQRHDAAFLAAMTASPEAPGPANISSSGSTMPRSPAGCSGWSGAGESGPATQVFISVGERSRPGASSTLPTLLSLERMLLRGAELSTGSDRTNAAISANPRCPRAFRPNIVIDLTDGAGTDVAPNAVRLRRSADGHPGERRLPRRCSSAARRASPSSASSTARNRPHRCVRHRLAGGRDRHRCAHRGGRLARHHFAAQGLSGSGAGCCGVGKPACRAIGTGLPLPTRRKTSPAPPRAPPTGFAATARTGIGWRFVEPGQYDWTRATRRTRWNVLADPIDLAFYADPFPLTCSKDYLFFETSTTRPRRASSPSPPSTS